MGTAIQKDLDYVGRIKIIQTILKILGEATGMRNSAVVSLAEDKWTAACTLDNNSFGLEDGDQLDMETTY